MANNQTINILVAQPIHRDGILKLAETALIPYEPVEQALGVTWEEARDSWEKLSDMCVQQGQSNVAVNSKNKVIGFRLSRVLDMEKMKPVDSVYEWLMEGHMKTVAERLTKNWSTVLPHTGKVLQFLALCVDPAYGGRGIALELVKANLALGKELGCTVATVIASNWMSQRVFEKSAFRTVGVAYHADYKDETGHQILCMKDPKQDLVVFYVKDLN